MEIKSPAKATPRRIIRRNLTAPLPSFGDMILFIRKYAGIKIMRKIAK
jgi:hypothetical protein